MYHMHIYKQHKYISTVYLRIYTVYTYSKWGANPVLSPPSPLRKQKIKNRAPFSPIKLRYTY